MVAGPAFSEHYSQFIQKKGGHNCVEHLLPVHRYSLGHTLEIASAVNSLASNDFEVAKDQLRIRSLAREERFRIEAVP